MLELERDIRDVVFPAVKAFAVTQGWAYQWPNKSIDRDTVAEYLSFSLLPTRGSNILVKTGGGIQVWLLSVNVYIRENANESAAVDMVDALKAAFPAAHEFSGALKTYQITENPRTHPPGDSDGWYFIPVQFRIQTLT